MMTKAKKTALFSAVLSFILCVIVAFGCIYASDSEKTAKKSDGYTVSLTADEGSAGSIDIAVDSNCQYVIIFSTSGTNKVQSLANSVKSQLYKGTGKLLTTKPQSQREQEFEILIGTTNRTVSQQMYAFVTAQATAEKPYVWAYGYSNGKLYYVASNDTAFELGMEDFLSLIDADGKLSVPADLNVVKSMTKAEYDKMLQDQAEAERQAIIDALKEKNEAFKTEEKLTTGYKSMIGADGYYQESPYAAPWVYPTEGQHPRYLITSKDVERILEMMDDPQYADVFENLRKFAAYDIKDGILPDRTGGSGEVYRYSETVITAIQARAMMYLLTGDEVYAYEAIIGIKNVILTLKYTTDLHMDVYHGASHVMVALSAVYDWCYDVLTEDDKWQIITGTVTCLWPTMEFNYPPSNMNGVSGHGTGPQFLRDYMSLAVVFYDEAPDWWEFIVGRYFEEYLPVANAQYANGWVSQGTACYAPIKLFVLLWSADLLYTCTGENYFTEDAALGIQMFIGQLQPNGRYFQTGDGGRTPNGTAPGFAEYLLSAALFNDPIAYSWAKYLSNDFKKYSTGSIFTMSPDFEICLLSRITAEEVDRHEAVGLVQYMIDPNAQMTVRNSWNDDAVAVFMKVGNMTNANHDIYDHGTFQIYYKGLLAATSGSYKKYGGDSHYYYLQCTVSQNGLLIFNPSFAGDAVMNGDKVTNPGTYYYSGSQHKLSGASTLTEWQNGSYHMADTTGAAWGYNADGSIKFGYLAGDITDAYDERTVDYVGRRMLTIYTGDEEIPMVFLTFDEIISDSESFEKTYLLHTVKEPTLDVDNMTAEIIEGDGRMIFTSLYGARVMEKIGGEGKAYWINGYTKEDGTYVEGKNCLDEYTPDDNYMNIWGRLQLRTSGEKTTNFLSAMYVSDATSTATLDITKFRTETVYGAAFGNNVTVFTVGREKQYKAFSFETEGNGLYNYYISGICDGTWNVKVDGISVAYSLSSDESGMLTFTAPAGTVEIIPGSDVLGANGGKIQYNSGGATLPDDAPYTYNNETETILPTTATRGEDVFLGWYLTSECLPEDRVYSVPAGTTGTFRVYAKWLTTFVNEDYSSSKVNAIKSSASVNGITYAGDGKPGSSFKTKTDEDGNGYLEWVKGPSDSFIYSINYNDNISTSVSDDKTISFTIEFSGEDGVAYLPTNFQIVSKSNASGGAISSQHTTLFRTDSNGKVTLGATKKIGSLKDGKVTVRIALDFKNGLIKAYDEDNNMIQSMSYVPASALGAAKPEDAIKCYTSYIFYWHGDSTNKDYDETMRIYKIKIQDGNIFESSTDVPAGGIKYNSYGGTLPKDAPNSYSNETPTLLPTNVVKEGAIFRGWYTSENYEESTRTYYVPTDTTGTYEVFAKWSYYVVDESFDGKSFIIPESTSGSNGSLSYNAGSANELKPGSSFQTVDDTDGNTYLKASVGPKNAIFYSSSSSYNLTHFTETAISFQFSLKKLEGIDFPSVGIRIPTSGSKYGEISVMNINEKGQATLTGASTVFATVGEDDYTTFRITVDFATATILAYDADGNVITDSKITSVPGGQSSLLEWQKVASNYMFYAVMSRSDKTEGAVSSMAVDNVRIAEGDIFYQEEIVLPTGNNINFVTNGGKLPDGALKEYDTENGTLLPNDVKREGYVFGGWYTDKEFKSRTYYVPAGTTGSYTVYAKWLTVLTDEDYSETDVDYEKLPGVNGGQPELGGITYNYLNDGTIFKTIEDENGHRYLRVDNKTPGKNAVIRTTDGGYNISTFNETAVSFELSFAKIPDVQLSSLGLSLEASSSVGGSGRLDLLKADPEGNVKLVGSDKVIYKITEDKFTTIRICVDFAAGTVTAYGENNEVLDSVTPSPESTTFDSLATWQREGLKHHILFLGIGNWNNAESGIEAGVLIDSIKVVDGRAFEAPVTKIPANTSVEYVTGGGKFKTDAPTEYDPETGLILPTDIEKDGYVFGGWFTSSDFAAGTEIDYIPMDSKGAFKVYAKWLTVLTDENYSETDVDYEKIPGQNGGQPYNNGIVYNYLNEGASFHTVEDEQGNKYLYVGTATPGKNAIFRTADGGYNISTFTETAVSFEVSFAKVAGTELACIGWTLETPGGTNGNLGLLWSDTDGNVMLSGSEKVIYKITEDKFTKVKICVDFEAGTVTAYGENNEILDSVTPAAPKDFGTLAKWQREGLGSHILFVNIYNPKDETNPEANTQRAILVDDIKVIDGRAFREPKAATPIVDTSIKYELNGGTLPSGALDKYDSETGYTLPTPTRDDHTFAGWFTSSDFSEDSRITEIAAGTEGKVKVYAKWTEVQKGTIVYELNGGELAENAPTEYICGTETELPKANRFGYKFMGWYTTSDFQEGTRVTSVPTDATGEFKVYAYFVYNL